MKCSMRGRALALALLAEVCGHELFAYLDMYEDLVMLAQTSTHLRRAVLGADIWSRHALRLCTDARCNHLHCGRKPVPLARMLTLLVCTPAQCCHLNLSVRDLGRVVEAVCAGNRLSSLHVRCRIEHAGDNVWASAAPLPRCSTLLHLTLYSDVALNTQLFEFLLASLGAGLTSLRLEESAPASLFPLLARLCPLLQRLDIDALVHAAEFASFSSTRLQHLRLGETRVDLSQVSLHANLPRLRSLEYCDAEGPSSVCLAVLNTPAALRELELHLPFTQSEAAVGEVGRRLHALTRLVLHLREADEEEEHGASEVGEAAMQQLVSGCPSLQHLEIMGSLLGGLSAQALARVGEMAALRYLCVAHSSAYLPLLPRLLAEAPSLAELVLFEDASYLGVPDAAHPLLTRWEVFAGQLEELGERFPAVALELRDDSHWLS